MRSVHQGSSNRPDVLLSTDAAKLIKFSCAQKSDWTLNSQTFHGITGKELETFVQVVRSAEDSNPPVSTSQVAVERLLISEPFSTHFALISNVCKL